MRRLLLPGALLGLLLAGPAPGADEAAAVSVATLEHAPPQAQLVLPGTVLARRSALLSVEVAGVVSQLAVDDGERHAPATCCCACATTRKPSRCGPRGPTHSARGRRSIWPPCRNAARRSCWRRR